MPLNSEPAATPRSYLFVTFEGGGNLPPVLGVARRLAARGHRVRVLTEPCLREVVEAIGAGFVPFTEHFTRTDRTRDLIGDWEASTPIGGLARTLGRVVLGPAGVVARATRDAIREERPDVVVADLMMPGALIAAESEGLPRVVLFHMPEYLPGPGRPAAGPGFRPRSDALGRLRDGLLAGILHLQMARHLPAVNRARREMGLAPMASGREIPDLYHRAELRLIQTSRAFDFPIDPPPPNVRYVGPMLDDPDWVGGWRNPWAEDDPRPLVVVSLSSTFQDQRGVIQRIMRGLGMLEVRALVTVGPAMARERFKVPPNVVAVASAPHTRAFLLASAVVTHAGHGTVMRALAHGLPLLCIPMGRDQADNAARVLHAGCGLRLRTRTHPIRIAAAVGRLLDDASFRENARRMGQTIREEMEGDRAVRELEEVGLPPDHRV